MRVSSDGITHPKVVPVDRGCCQKDPKILRPESKILCLSTSGGGRFLWFWSDLHTNCFPVIYPLVSSEKYPLGRIAHFPNELWPKKCRFSRFFTSWHCMSLWLSLSGNSWGVRCFALTLASQHNVSNAHWMVAVRFFNLELGPIEFLTHWVQNFRVQNRLFKMVANTVDRNILALVALHVSTTSMGRVGRVPFTLGHFALGKLRGPKVLIWGLSCDLTDVVSRGSWNLQYLN